MKTRTHNLNKQFGYFVIKRVYGCMRLFIRIVIVVDGDGVRVESEHVVACKVWMCA